MAGDDQSTDLATRRRSLEAKLAAAGIDASKPDFVRRAYDMLAKARTRLAVLQELADHARLHETPATGGVTTPGHGQSPQLGTTVGDAPSILDLGMGGEALDEGQKFKDDFLDRMWNQHIEQGGLKISPTDAAGRTEPGDGQTGGGVLTQPEPVDPGQKALEEGREAMDRAMKDFEQRQQDAEFMNSLSMAAAATDEAARIFFLSKAMENRVKQHMEMLKDAENKARQALDRLRQPNPDAPDAGGTLSVGGMAPKKPGKPGDPLPDNPNTEPSHVLKQRGQATDPNPAADYWGLGAPKAIRTTSDAVIDPPRAERKGLFGLFSGSALKSAKGAR